MFLQPTDDAWPAHDTVLMIRDVRLRALKNIQLQDKEDCVEEKEKLEDCVEEREKSMEFLKDCVFQWQQNNHVGYRDYLPDVQEELRKGITLLEDSFTFTTPRLIYGEPQEHDQVCYEISWPLERQRNVQTGHTRRIRIKPVYELSLIHI